MAKSPDWERYEQEKKRIAWTAKSAEEYERLMKELAKRLGV